ncbi:MAG: hypothetical protein JWO67_4353 [Streptosporangiaceae bacterium]|nr:hypothetical protein [Streptosporangiaceae bacterium]
MATIESLLHRRADLSTFVVHFTRDTSDSAYSNLGNILWQGRLEARNVYGMAKGLAARVPEVASTQRAVCFTETPLEHAWMMCSDIEGRDVRFNGYGVAFTKTFARRLGANPVWYLDITPGHDWLTGPINRMVEEAERSAQGWGADSDPAGLATSDILRLTPFIEQMGPLTGGGRKEFWWEREWRHVGDMQFAATDVVVVFAPEASHETLRTWLRGNPRYQVRVPAFVDADWGLERMIGTLAGVADLGPFPQ